MADIGRFNRQVVIQARDPSAVDSSFQPVENWQPFATVWAEFVFTPGARVGLEAVRGGVMVSAPPAVWRTRFRQDITAAMRLVDGSTVYNIKSVVPNMAHKDVTDLICEVQHG